MLLLSVPRWATTIDCAAGLCAMKSGRRSQAVSLIYRFHGPDISHAHTLGPVRHLRQIIHQSIQGSAEGRDGPPPAVMGSIPGRASHGGPQFQPSTALEEQYAICENLRRSMPRQSVQFLLISKDARSLTWPGLQTHPFVRKRESKQLRSSACRLFRIWVQRW